MMAHVEQPQVKPEACVHKHRKLLGPKCDYSCYSTIPVDIWEEIFIHCLPTPEDSDDYAFTPRTAPLLLCQVCRDWRRLANSLPSLWTFLRVRISFGKPYPPTRILLRWLKRTGTSPLALSLIQTSEAESNRIAAVNVLEIFDQYIHRWQHIKLDLASPLHCNRSDPQKRKAPLLEEFHMRTQRLDAISEHGFLGRFNEIPRLSALSVPSMASFGYCVDLTSDIPWYQLTHISIDSGMSVGKMLLLLSECRILTNCKFGVDPVPDTQSHPTIIHPTLKTLNLTIHPQALSEFLQQTTFPALSIISIYENGGSAEASAWPQKELNTFLERSKIRLHYLGLHNTCIRNAHFVDLLQTPAMQTVMELVVEDNTDWIFTPCLSFSVLEMLTFNEFTPQGLLPALRCFRMRGLNYLWSIDSKALVDMAESRWRLFKDCSAVRLRVLQAQLSQSDFPADYCRLKQLQKEGLDLELGSTL